MILGMQLLFSCCHEASGSSAASGVAAMTGAGHEVMPDCSCSQPLKHRPASQNPWLNSLEHQILEGLCVARNLMIWPAAQISISNYSMGSLVKNGVTLAQNSAVIP